MSDWLTYQEAADALGISVRTLQRRIREGYIRVTRRELEAHRSSPEHKRGAAA